jgi:Arm DNA-binding domain
VLEAKDILAYQPADKPYKRFDARGLFLLVSPYGGKWWRVNYRFDGKHKTLSVGVFPVVSIEQARARRDEIRKLVARRIDPATIRRDAKARQLRKKYKPSIIAIHLQSNLMRLPWQGPCLARI